MILSRGIFALIVLLVSQRVFCQNNESFVLKATIDSLPNSVYYINYEYNGVPVRDSVILDANKSFSYTGHIKEPEFVYIGMKNNYNKRLVGDFDLCRFWVEPNSVTNLHMLGGWKTFSNIGWKPTYENAIFDISSTKTDSIYRIYLKHVNLQVANWKDTYQVEPNSDQYKLLLKKSMLFFLTERHPDHFSLWLIDQLSRFEDTDIIFMDSLLATFPMELKNTFRASAVSKKLKDKMTLEIGKPLPSFTLPDTSLQEIDLSKIRGKFILVDFWASWCGPCRKEIPFLKQLYTKFNKKGFNIVSISLDEDPDKWKAAIDVEKLAWTQLSGLGGFKGEVAKRFDVTSIPDNFLVDSNGIIVARNIHGNALYKALEEMFYSSE